MQDIRITVALELNDLDPKILEYTRFICRSLAVSKIYFLHVCERMEVPPAMLKAHPELADLPADESFEDQMREAVNTHLKLESEIEMDFDSVQGHALEGLLKHARMKHADLLIVGKRDSAAAKEQASAKLARKAQCSVLFVPETFDLDIQNILVPIDFSEHSQLAAQTALQMSEIVDGDTVHLLNIYKVPDRYYVLGETYEESSQVTCNYAKEEAEEFQSKLKLLEHNEVEQHFIDLNQRDKAEVIIEQIQKLNCQLLVMGSKGRTNLSAMLLGSMTEKLIQCDLKLPIMIVKKKDENMGFLDALLQISKI